MVSVLPGLLLLLMVVVVPLEAILALGTRMDSTMVGHGVEPQPTGAPPSLDSSEARGAINKACTCMHMIRWLVSSTVFAACTCSLCALQVLQDEVPLPPPGTVSELCRDFLALCLHRDPARRPAATALLTHPWVAQAAATNVKGLMKKTMFLEDDRYTRISAP
jgi:serine/threonine protein kinase